MPCEKLMTKKYSTRPGPPFPAQECRGQVRQGNDSHMYKSEMAANGVYRWKRVTSMRGGSPNGPSSGSLSGGKKMLKRTWWNPITWGTPSRKHHFRSRHSRSRWFSGGSQKKCVSWVSRNPVLVGKNILQCLKARMAAENLWVLVLQAWMTTRAHTTRIRDQGIAKGILKT